MSTELSLTRISDQDARQFLQGQLTNDVNALRLSWQFTGYCSVKGRLIMTGILLDSGEDLFLLCHPTVQETVISTLSKYRLRSKVSFTPVAATFQLVPGEANEHSNHNVTLSQAGVLQLDLGNATLVVTITPNDAGPTASDSDAFDAQWRHWRVSNGICIIDAALQEKYVPQMINLDQIDGINFKKGCYTGQEIVARMHYLGKLKQRLVKLIEPESHKQAVQQGNSVIAFVGDEALQIGDIVATDPSHRQHLAVVRLEHSDQPLASANDLSEPFSIEPLPYG